MVPTLCLLTEPHILQVTLIRGGLVNSGGGRGTWGDISRRRGAWGNGPKTRDHRHEVHSR